MHDYRTGPKPEYKASAYDELWQEAWKLRKAYDHLMEVAVSRWHQADIPPDTADPDHVSLIEWLEVSWDEYGKWMEDSSHVMTFLGRPDQ